MHILFTQIYRNRREREREGKGLTIIQSKDKCVVGAVSISTSNIIRVD